MVNSIMAENRKTGHRQRLRERFLAGGPESYTNEALLELLLTFAIGRKDVRPIAQELIQVFSSLSQVLSASPDELCKVKGIGQSSITLLKVVNFIKLGIIPPETSFSLTENSDVNQLSLFEDTPNGPKPKSSSPSSRRKKPSEKKTPSIIIEQPGKKSGSSTPQILVDTPLKPLRPSQDSKKTPASKKSIRRKFQFLPRGHNTVRQTGMVKGYMHGGATPEEVIVPTASYKMVKAAWKTPSARFLNLDLVKETGAAKFYIQRVVTLEIEIQNLNSTEIRIHRASVISPETDLKSCETVTIPAGSVNTLRMNCYFKKAALDKKSLEIEIAYEIAGEQRTFPITLDSEFKSAMSVGLNLRDL